MDLKTAGKRVMDLTTAERIERRRRQNLRRIQDFRLMDDDFLTECFEGHTESIQLVLRIVLENPDLKVLDVRTQVFVENLLNRSVRLDVLATDDTGRKFNVEVQREDKGAGKKRARYNSSMMDANLLDKGKHFDQLPETWVVFITENDVMGHGKALYRVERCVLDTGEKFEDGSHILYVNGAYRDDTPIGKLMHDFSCTDPADMHYDVLADRVRFFKESKEGVAIMCKAMEDMINEALKEGIEQGIERGIEQSTKDIAVRMLKSGKYALEEIADVSGLSLDEVRRLDASRIS